jgi:uncharacterized membrane protein
MKRDWKYWFREHYVSQRSRYNIGKQYISMIQFFMIVFLFAESFAAEWKMEFWVLAVALFILINGTCWFLGYLEDKWKFIERELEWKQKRHKFSRQMRQFISESSNVREREGLK